MGIVAVVVVVVAFLGLSGWFMGTPESTTVVTGTVIGMSDLPKNYRATQRGFVVELDGGPRVIVMENIPAALRPGTRVQLHETKRHSPPGKSYRFFRERP